MCLCWWEILYFVFLTVCFSLLYSYVACIIWLLSPVSTEHDIFQDKAARREQEPSLHKIYLRAFWPYLLLAAVFRLTGDLLAFVGPWCIESVVNYAYGKLETANQNLSSSIPSLNYTPVSSSNFTVNLTSDTENNLVRNVHKVLNHTHVHVHIIMLSLIYVRIYLLISFH